MKEKPRYVKGDKVLAQEFYPNECLVVKDSFHNGFTWMYSFEGKDMSCGEMYLTKFPTLEEVEARIKIKEQELDNLKALRLLL